MFDSTFRGMKIDFRYVKLYEHMELIYVTVTFYIRRSILFCILNILEDKLFNYIICWHCCNHLLINPMVSIKYKPLKLSPSSLLARELGAPIQSFTHYPIEKTQK